MNNKRIVEMLNGPIPIENKPIKFENIESSTKPTVEQMSNSELWKEFQILKRTRLSERQLVLDLLFVLKGVDGKYIKIDQQGTFRLSPNYSREMGPSVSGMVGEIAACGNLFKRIEEGARFTEGEGSIRRAFCNSVKKHLRIYLKKIACIEATVLTDGQNLTLRRLFSWLTNGNEEGGIVDLLFLTSLVDEARGLRGGPLFSCVHRYRTHGNTLLGQIASNISKEMLRPIHQMLASFVTYGTLCDASGEFFICPPKSSQTFKLCPEKLPSIISLEQGERVLLAGKTRAFLASLATGTKDDRLNSESEFLNQKSLIMGSDFNQTYVNEKKHTKGEKLDLINEQRDDEKIAILIEKEHKLACRILRKTLFERLQLRLHLSAIRDYLHFGRGDFAGALIDSIAGPLSKPATSLFRHALVSCLDQALFSMQGMQPEIKDRLDVRLHDFTAGSKLVGWDIFTLDYRIDPELSTIISSEAMTEHVRVSHFLWSLRRVLHSLTDCSRRVLHMRRNVKKIGLQSVLDPDLSRMHRFLQEGAVFSRHLVTFAHSGVSEAWGNLFGVLDKNEIEDFQETGGVDWYVTLHDALLKNIRERLFIFASSAARTRLAVTLSSLLRTENVFRALERYINLCGEYVSRMNGTQNTHWSVSREDEHLIQQGTDFNTTQSQMISEYRVSFQTTVRTFFSELDAFLLHLRKEEASAIHNNCISTVSDPKAFSIDQYAGMDPVSRLLLLIDYGGYHTRRGPTELQKYLAVN